VDNGLADVAAVEKVDIGTAGGEGEEFLGQILGPVVESGFEP
jgi:hypothetical protein